MQSFSIEIKDEAFRKYRRPAIIEYWGDDGDHLNYSTPITVDVLGNLTGAMVCDILGKIICLPAIVY